MSGSIPGYSKPAPEFQAELDLHFGPSTERYDALVQEFFSMGEDGAQLDGEAVPNLRIIEGLAADEL